MSNTRVPGFAQVPEFAQFIIILIKSLNNPNQSINSTQNLPTESLCTSKLSGAPTQRALASRLLWQNPGMPQALTGPHATKRCDRNR